MAEGYLIETLDEDGNKKPRAGVWAISRFIDGDWRHFVENHPLEDPHDFDRVLAVLGISRDAAEIEKYFFTDPDRQYCPKLALLERLSQRRERVVGV